MSAWNETATITKAQFFLAWYAAAAFGFVFGFCVCLLVLL